MSPLEFVTDRRKSGQFRVAVTVGGLLLLISLLSAALNAQRDIAELKAGKLDRSTYEIDQERAATRDSLLLRDMSTVKCLLRRPAGECPL